MGACTERSAGRQAIGLGQMQGVSSKAGDRAGLAESRERQSMFLPVAGPLGCEVGANNGSPWTGECGGRAAVGRDSEEMAAADTDPLHRTPCPNAWNRLGEMGQGGRRY
jgi:hypothetical protein